MSINNHSSKISKSTCLYKLNTFLISPCIRASANSDKRSGKREMGCCYDELFSIFDWLARKGEPRSIDRDSKIYRNIETEGVLIYEKSQTN